MKEYRIEAYFSEVYTPRSYKRMVFRDLEAAKKVFVLAKEYYSNYPYLEKVVIEEREVTEWKEQL